MPKLSYDEHQDDDENAPHLKIPAGSRNYITPAGYARLKAELHDLLYKKRPEMTATVAWAAGNGDRSENADLKTCAIVGINEINPARSHISWTSPLARGLLKAGVGDVVTFQSPKGLREIEIVEIRYETIKPEE